MSLPRPLIDRFLVHLGGLAGELETLEGRLAASPDAQGASWETLREIAHQLAGTAEPFGFARLGQAARGLEAAVMNKESAPATRFEAVRAMRDALEAAVMADPPLP